MSVIRHLAFSLAIALTGCLTSFQVFGEEQLLEASKVAETPAPNYRLYVQERTTHEKRIQQAREDAEGQKRELRVRANSVNSEIAALGTQASKLRAEIEASRSQDGVLKVLERGLLFAIIPEIGATGAFDFFGGIAATFRTGFASIGNAILNFFLPLTALNLLLYTIFREKVIWRRFRWIIIGISALFFLGFAAPLLAEEDAPESEISKALNQAVSLLAKSDHERYIALLEARPQQPANLPILASGHPLFNVDRYVVTGSVGYHTTLAALYMHEQQVGRAVDEIKKLKELPSSTLRNQQKKLVNAVKFLIAHQQREAAGDLLTRITPLIENMDDLLGLSEHLRSVAMEASADNLIDAAIARKNSVGGLVSLAQYFYRHQQVSKAEDALGKAANQANSTAEIMQVAGFALDHQREDILKRLLDKLTMSPEARVGVVDLLIRANRRELAANTLGEAIGAIKKSTRDYDKKLRYLIDAALSRNMNEQALVALNKLSLYLGRQAYSAYISLPPTMQPSFDLSERSRISIPLFYGMLNQHMGFRDRAESAYERVVVDSLGVLIDSYGYQAPDTFNEFDLLTQSWIDHDDQQLLGLLDQVISELNQRRRDQENAQLQTIQLSLNKEVEAAKAQLASAEQRRSTLSAEVSRLQEQSRQIAREAQFESIASFTRILFSILVLSICFAKGYQYASKLPAQKTYGFITKALEVLGWIRILSVIGAISGLLTVFLTQLLQLLQGPSAKDLEIAAPRQMETNK